VGGGGKTPLARWLYYPPSRTRRCRCSNLVLAVGNDAGVSAACTQTCARARAHLAACPRSFSELIRGEELAWRFRQHNGVIEGEIRSSHRTLPRKNSNRYPLTGRVKPCRENVTHVTQVWWKKSKAAAWNSLNPTTERLLDPPDIGFA
jgi:hypothetical protein